MGTSSLYEDDGRSAAYENSGFARTSLSYTRRDNAVEIKIAPPVGHFAGQPTARGYSIELPATRKGTQATLQINGAAQNLTSIYDEATQTNRIVVPAQPINRNIAVTVNCGLADTSVMAEKARKRRIAGITGKAPASNDAATVLSDNNAATPEQKQMLLATFGIGLAKEMEGPNYAKNPGLLAFYAPQNSIKNLNFSRRDGNAFTAVTGSVVPLGAVKSPRDSPIVSFQIGNQNYQLPTIANPLLAANNIALDAKVSVSSTEKWLRQKWRQRWRCRWLSQQRRRRMVEQPGKSGRDGASRLATAANSQPHPSVRSAQHNRRRNSGRSHF